MSLPAANENPMPELRHGIWYDTDKAVDARTLLPLPHLAAAH
jgi:hypothetical protein